MPGTLRPPPGAAARRWELPGAGSAPRRPPIGPIPRGEGHSARLGGGRAQASAPRGRRNPPLTLQRPVPHPQSGVPVLGEFAGLRGRFPAVLPHRCQRGLHPPGPRAVDPGASAPPTCAPRQPSAQAQRSGGGGAAQCAGAEWRRGAGRGGLVRRRRGPGWCSRGWRGLGCVAPAPGCPSQHGGTGLRRAWPESALQSHNPDQLWKF